MTNEILEMIVKYQDEIDKITDLLDDLNIPSQDGEFILSWIIGLSAGLRQGSLMGDISAARYMAEGYRFAAQNGDMV
jgi:hypothetical protein